MKKNAIIATLCACTLLLNTMVSNLDYAAINPQKSPSLLIEQLEDNVNNYLELSGANSVQYALLDNNQLVLSGVKNFKGDNLSQKTNYEIGSVSKMFVTAAVMKLVDEGKIDLDTPLTKYIPEFKMKDQRYKRITSRMLLNHSSGLRGTESSNDALFEDNDTLVHDTLLKTLSTQTLKAEPGAFSVYCNSGFTLAEILVEQVSGLSFSEFIKTQITTPLNMTATFTPQDGITNRHLAPYYVGSKALKYNDYCNAIGSGGIISTAEDMIQFSKLFMSNGSTLLSKAAIASMSNEEYKKGLWPQEADDSSYYGLGWDSVKTFPFDGYGIKAITKGGDLSTFSASLIVLPEKNMSVVVLASGASSSEAQVLGTRLLLEVLKSKGDIKNILDNKTFEAFVPQPLPVKMLDYSGYYANSDGQSLIQIKKDGTLTLSNAANKKYYYTKDGSFMDQARTTKLNFVNEKNGKIYLRMRAYTTYDQLGQMAMNEYVAEKLTPFSLPKSTLETWSKRNGQKYYATNLKYSSDGYYFGEPSLVINLDNGHPGYWEDRKIETASTAVSHVQIPGLSGRDTTEAKFYSLNNTEYLDISGMTLISEDALTSLPNQKNTTFVSRGSQTAKWYKISHSIIGKTLSVSMPKHAMFAVYDKDGTCIINSYVDGNKQIKLTNASTLVLVGENKARFELTLTQ